MKGASGKMIAASCITCMDVEVVVRFGPVLWHYGNTIAWARITLLLLAGAMAFTLMDIWSKTLYFRSNLLAHKELGINAPSSCEAIEVADV